MLSILQLKYHCRVCMIKVELFDDENQDPKKSVLLSRYPEIEQLIHTCLGGDRTMDDGIGGKELESYMPNLCRTCFEKWSDFTKHYQLLLKTEEKLRKVVIKESPIPDNVEEDNKIFIETDPIADLCEIEKYETNSPFYQGSILSNASSQEDQTLNDAEGDTEDSQEAINTSPLPSLKSDILGDENAHLDETNDSFLLDMNPPRAKRARRIKQIGPERSKPCTSKRKNRKQHSSKSTRGDKSSSNDSESNSKKKVLFRCEPCKKYFYGIRRYEGHIKLVHEGIKKAFECEECGKAYKFYKNLTEHIADNHSEKPQDSHFCHLCNKEFKTQTTLKNHQKIKHPDPNDEEACNSRRVICEQCGFLAASSESLTAHIKNKHTEDPEQFKCEHCPKVFKCRYYLNYHIMNNHSTEKIKPFKCSDCDMAFSRRNGLNKHKLTHLDYDDRIKCDFQGCNVRFLIADAKKRHVRLVHLKEKQHVCDICGEAFGIKATLRHHRYIHTGEKPYKCTVCGQAFRQHTAMKTHAKTHFTKGLKATKTQDLLSNTLKSNNIELESSMNIF